MRSQAVVRWCLAVGLVVLLGISLDRVAQGQEAAVPARITTAVDPRNMVVLHGNVHPLARAEFDQGAVADAQPLHRMLLLLQRSAEQETALRQLLDAQESKSSGNFQSWLTPEQFGAQFGPAASDVQTVTTWLQSQGFQINRVSAGQTVIEFDGTAGQVRNAFRTQIHRYVVNGQERSANSTDPEIPAALAPVVAGIVSLHNFPAVSHLRTMGTYRGRAQTVAGQPLYTPQGSTQNFPLAPADFATIYNVTPLWNSGIDGTGQTVAVIGETDVDVTDIQNFRALFSLPNNFSSDNVIVDGIDPGIVDGDETESDLDLEWSGAVAKNATIKFVTAAGTEATSGVHLAALYAVDHNVAAVLSESYGVCEPSLGATSNQFYNGLWEQAAAQGTTVVISAGDGGSAGCDNFDTEEKASLGIAVSGYASTPFDVAVGGTDFDQVNKWQQFWSATNDSTFGSALGYIPEIPWNDSCAQAGLNVCGTSQPGGSLLNIVAGSGGPSSIYSKPSWQSGLGVPPDNKRDIPDVSLFASNGFDGTGYLICENDHGAACQLSGQSFSYDQVGGTSASAPAFAGIMALVNHAQAKQNLSNRQGNANYVLYALAKKQGNITPALNCNASAVPVAACTFNDITRGNSFFPNTAVGNNSVPCETNSANCSVVTGTATGILVAPGTTTPPAPAWTTTAGYDLATGLGSVNALNLVTNWNSVNGTPTTTTLTLNGGTAVSVTHGASVPVSISVSPTAAVGDVALVGTLSAGNTVGMAHFTLANGAASGSTSNLSGGTYSVVAHYEGDGTNAPSDSVSVTVTVAPEPSKTLLSVPTFDPNTGRETSATPSTLVYGSFYLVRADVTNAAGSLTALCANVNVLSCPTGSVSITDSFNGGTAKPLDSGVFSLNSLGYTEDQNVFLQGGAHMLVAQYAGDNSYAKSASTPYSVMITPAPATLAFETGNFNAVVGQPILLTAEMENGVIDGAAPTGTVTFFDGATMIPGNVAIAASAGSPNNNGVLFANLTTTLTTNGTHSITAKYSGDADYAAAITTPIIVSAFYPTTLSLSASSQNLVYGNPTTLTATVTTTNKAPVLTGQITFSGSLTGNLSDPVTQTVGTDANGNTEIVATTTTTPQNSELLSANFSNDRNYNDNTQSLVVQVTIPDFTVSAPSTILLTAGQTGMATLNITPASKLSSTVALACIGSLPAGSTCSFAPPSVMLANMVAGSSILSLTSIPPTGAAVIAAHSQHRSILGLFFSVPRNPWWGLSLLAGLAALGMLILAAQRQRNRLVFGAAFAAGLLCVVSFAWGCGGGGGSAPPPPPALAQTTTTITSAMAKVPQGMPVTLTATVSSTRALTGNVSFVANGQSFGVVALLNGMAQLQISSLPIGTSAVTATYSGDSNNQASTSPGFNQVITGSTQFFVSAQTGPDIHNTLVTATIQ
jgi:hypothetical protein